MTKRTILGWALGALALVLPAMAQDSTTSYRRVLSPADRKAYESSGGRQWLGSLVHVHVRATAFKRETAHPSAGKPDGWVEFADGSVPILVSSGSEYLAQLRRKLERGARGTICVKGRVVSPSWAANGKCYLVADTLKRAPGNEGVRPRTSSSGPRERRRES